MTINLTIVGGCFTEQHNIAFDKLYHQLVRNAIENEFGIEMKLDIIRYERFSKCLEKISDHFENNQIDILIFHIRSEQFLRLSKLYYRFADGKGRINHSLNLPFLKILNPEKHKLPGSGMIIRDNQLQDRNSFWKKTKLREILAEMNYISGILAGNVNLCTEVLFGIAGLCRKFLQK